ncbi:hypothetical protein J6590_071097 [Homalodisca vitripennis]|nr:hypothetical protein J6590_071097 [Homalodisca vitripennis]
MATPQQKAQCVIWLVETNSVTTVQRYFRREYGGNVPDPKSIRKWIQQFKDTGSVLKGKSPGRPTVSAENVERIRASCCRSPKKSLVRRSLELGLPRSTVYDVKPQEIVQYQRDLPKVNAWCGLMNDQIDGPFIFAEKTITDDIYCDMLELYVFPQVDDIEAEKGPVIFQQEVRRPTINNVCAQP